MKSYMIKTQVKKALLDPLSYEVAHGILGWTLQGLDNEFALLISQQEAAQIIRAQKAAQVYDGFYDDTDDNS